jgi:protocatechuate 3,4-dioxygenase beta subunit
VEHPTQDHARAHEHADDHDDFGGLARDLPGLLGRRRALRLMAGAGLGVGAAGLLAACSSGGSSSSSASTAGATATTADSAGSTATTAATAATAAIESCVELPEETAGPYPGDGSNGPDVLAENGVVRSDIRSSFGSMSGTADGVPLTIDLRVLDADTCEPVPGAAVYLWQCDAAGRYSLYSQGATDQNYLRGVQAADDDGRLTFVSTFPGCYSGRWPHIHFEVYQDLDAAQSVRNKVATSQIALPADASAAVYATDGYSGSSANLARVSLSSDMVFRDGAEAQTPGITGSASSGYRITMDCAVSFAGSGSAADRT